MKNILILVSLLFTAPAFAQVTQQSVTRIYVDKAYELYKGSTDGARKLQADLDRLLSAPNEKNLATARQTWTDARKIYSQTEVYRFYGGPIDGNDGPEGFINAWPLDEVYIDDIIANTNQYPDLSIKSLRGLNEKDGEKNISTGWHALEYMLWGKDLSADGPGQRPASDFAANHPLAARRAAYVKAVAQALVEDLDGVTAQWDLNKKGSYGQRFLTAKDSLTNMLIGVTKMSGAELSQERMYVALDKHDQEEEHSCFSDTTHLDIIYNVVGIQNVMKPIVELIRLKDPASAQEITDALAMTDKAVRAIPPPFDRAISKSNPAGNRKVMDAIAALETLTEAIRQGAVSIGVDIP